MSQDREDRAAFRGDAKGVGKGAGVLLYLSLENIATYYREILAKRLRPATEPEDRPAGNREFLLPDPDGYNLMIFQRRS